MWEVSVFKTIIFCFSTTLPTEICSMGIHKHTHTQTVDDFVWLWVIRVPHRALIPLLIDLASFTCSVFILKKLGNLCFIWDSSYFMCFCFFAPGDLIVNMLRRELLSGKAILTCHDKQRTRCTIPDVLRSALWDEMHDKKTTCGWKNSNAVIRNSCFCFVQEKIIENNLQEFAWLYILEPEESTTTCYFLIYKANCIYGRFQSVFHSRMQLIYHSTDNRYSW